MQTTLSFFWVVGCSVCSSLIHSFIYKRVSTSALHHTINYTACNTYNYYVSYMYQIPLLIYKHIKRCFTQSLVQVPPHYLFILFFWMQKHLSEGKISFNSLRNVHKYILSTIVRCDKTMTFVPTKILANPCLLWRFWCNSWSERN